MILVIVTAIRALLLSWEGLSGFEAESQEIKAKDDGSLWVIIYSPNLFH